MMKPNSPSSSSINKDVLLLNVNVPVDCLGIIYSKPNQYNYWVEIRASFLGLFPDGDVMKNITYNQLDGIELQHINWQKFVPVVEELVNEHFKELHGSTTKA